MTPVPGVRFGEYVLVRKLAAGGMGELFLAYRSGRGRPLALKRMLPALATDPDRAQRFADEARLALQLDHPFVVRTLDVGEAEGTPFFAMEFLLGANLAEVIASLRRKGPCPWELAARIGICLGEGLEYVHGLQTASGRALHLVHRDLEPSNIVLTSVGAPKLIDFGIAMADFRKTATQPGVLFTKLRYAAPEQVRLEPVDARTDVYGLALSLFELLTGQCPFVRATPDLTLRAVQGELAPHLNRVRRGLPRALGTLLAGALAKRPSERPASAAVFRAALEDILLQGRRRASLTDLAAWLQSLVPGTRPTLKEQVEPADAVTERPTESL